MCGIVGLVFLQSDIGQGYFKTKNKNAVYKRVFRSMLSIAQPLGHDATGVFVGRRRLSSSPKVHDIAVYKQPGQVSSFLASEKGSRLIDDYVDTSDTAYVVGHVRAGTGGSAFDNHNNHPFICGNVVGVHNGIIYNDNEVSKDCCLDLKGSCDSEVIFSLVNKLLTKEGTEKNDSPIIDAVLKTHKLLKGWYTCVLADKRDFSRLVLFKHKAPLALMFEPNDGVLLFASQKEIVLEAAKKHSLPTDKLVDIQLGDNEGLIIDVYANTTPAEATRFELDYLGTDVMESVGVGVGDDTSDDDGDCSLAGLAREQAVF